MQKTSLIFFIITAACFLGELRIATSQNIISNNDFELYSTLPLSQGEIAKAIGWEEIIQSADYMNTTYVCWSPEIGGAHSGNGFAGFATYGDLTGSAEAIGQNISSSPIIINSNYSISLYAKKTSGGSYNQSCGGISLYGYTSPPPLGGISDHASNLSGATLLWTSNNVSDSLWKYYNGCFQSSVVINYIVITLEKTPGCMQYVFIDSLNIEPKSITNLGNDTMLCQGQTINLNGGLATSYLWSNGSTNTSISVSTSGTYWVQATNGQCSATDSIVISINQYPATNLGNDTALCQGQTVALNGGAATSYLWSNGSTAASISVSTSGTYWVQSSNGQCDNSDTLSVLISNCEIEIELPNVFTPNNDGVNDNFIPSKYKGISKANLIIYNRWGEKLFYTDNLILGWNGSYKDNNCSDGTYFWIVQYTTIMNESKELKGVLTLIK
jgi:gliding motility-associated-like protein